MLRFLLAIFAVQSIIPCSNCFSDESPYMIDRIEVVMKIGQLRNFASKHENATVQFAVSREKDGENVALTDDFNLHRESDYERDIYENQTMLFILYGGDQNKYIIVKATARDEHMEQRRRFFIDEKKMINYFKVSLTDFDMPAYKDFTNATNKIEYTGNVPADTYRSSAVLTFSMTLRCDGMPILDGSFCDLECNRSKVYQNEAHCKSITTGSIYICQHRSYVQVARCEKCEWGVIDGTCADEPVDVLARAAKLLVSYLIFTTIPILLVWTIIRFRRITVN